MEDAVHGKPQGVVVGIDGFGVELTSGRVEGLGGGEERFDSFVAENDERGDRAKPAGERFVAASVADAANDLFAAKLFEIVGGVAGTVWCTALAHPGRDLGGGEAIGRWRLSDHRLDDRAHAGLVEIDAADDGFADL